MLGGRAGPEILATYEQERRPPAKLTVEQAYTRYVTRSATYLGARDYEPQINDFNIELGYLYHSPTIIEDGADTAAHADPKETLGRPGSRAPHFWIEKDGARVSTVDLFGTGFTLLAATNGAGWYAAEKEAANVAEGFPLKTYGFRTRALRSRKSLRCCLRNNCDRRCTCPARRLCRLARENVRGEAARHTK